MRALQRPNVTFAPTHRLKSVERGDNGLLANVTSGYLDQNHERRIDLEIVIAGHEYGRPTPEPVNEKPSAWLGF